MGHSYVAQGRLGEASKTFSKLLDSEGFSKRAEVVLALAELYRSLGMNDKAFVLLDRENAKRELGVAGKISLAELCLDKGDANHAQRVITSIPEELQKHSITIEYLNARLDQERGDHQQAIQKFQSITENPKVHGGYKELSVLGMADSYTQTKHLSKAAKALIDLAEQDAKSAFLEPIFARLLKLVGQLEDKELLVTSLKKWVQRASTNDVELKNGILELADRDAFAHFLLSKILTNAGDEASLVKSDELLDLLRSGHPEHFLVTQSWFASAENQLLLGNSAVAIEILKEIVNDARVAKDRQRAQLLVAIMHAESGDFEKSLASFREIDKQDSIYADISYVNQAVLELQRGQLLAFKDVVDLVDDETLRNGLLYEKAILGVSGGKEGSINTLEKLVHSVQHPLQVDAQIILAKQSLGNKPLDLEYTSKKLKALKVSDLTVQQGEEVATMEMRFLVLTNQWDKVIKHYTKLKDSGELDSVKLSTLMGEAYYRNGEYNKARREFNIVIKQYPNSSYVEYAKFYSALAARKEGTPQSRTEAVELFQAVIDQGGVFKSEAVIQRARILIDQSKFNQAVEELTDIVDKEKSETVKAQFHVLLGEAHYAKGIVAKEEVKPFKDAELHFSQALKHYQNDPVWSNRIHFMLGKTREEIFPTSGKALETYFTVVNLENTRDKKRPAEWDWYYKAGLRSVEILEQEQRWATAANLLEKMAGMYGPKSDVLSERAGKIRLKHHIW